MLKKKFKTIRGFLTGINLSINAKEGSRETLL